MSESLDDYDYDLPKRLIATRPLAERNASRMLVLHRESGKIEHRRFLDFPSFLQSGDRVILNNSKVFKARLYSDDARIELLFLEEISHRRWKCMVRPGRKMREGMQCQIAGIAARVDEIFPGGERLISLADDIDFAVHGHMPVPPYFDRQSDAADDTRYQTVYAGPSGSVAAPTAGLHFTNEVLAQIPHSFVTLHVGAGTFQPVKVDRIADHVMHSERYSFHAETADAINAAKRLVAIGTTSARVLESLPPGPVTPQSGSTNIYIYPPYSFQRVQVLLTNFHLPKSTLLMLVSAMAGREHVLDAYREAIHENYRFYSYGDCMLIE